MSAIGFILNIQKKARKRGLSVIARRVAVITVAISVAVMVIAFAVVDGYRSQLSGAIGAIVGDYKLSGVEQGARWNRAPMNVDSILEENILKIDGVESVMPVVRSGGVIKSDDGLKGVAVIGVDFNKLMESKFGSFVSVKDSNIVSDESVIISKSLANSLGVEVGQEVMAIFFRDQPIMLNLVIGAVFDTHMEEIDKGIIWVPREKLSNALGYESGMVDFYQIAVNEPSEIIEEQLYELSNEDVVLENAQEEYAYIYEWIVMLNNNIAVLIIIVSIVVGINIIAVVLIVILESTSDIGILKSLGMKSRSLMTIYGLKMFTNTIVGVIVGMFVGVGFCVLQESCKIVKLDPVSYLVDAVPIDISWISVTCVGLGAILIVTLFAMLPTLIIAKISPHKTLKFE